jgi:hypothetical protein
VCGWRENNCTEQMQDRLASVIAQGGLALLAGHRLFAAPHLLQPVKPDPRPSGEIRPPGTHAERFALTLAGSISREILLGV